MTADIGRPRISFDVSFDLREALLKELGGRRVINALYSKITEDLVLALSKMSSREKNYFIYVLMKEENTDIIEYLKQTREAKHEVEKLEEEHPRDGRGRDKESPHSNKSKQGGFHNPYSED